MRTLTCNEIVSVSGAGYREDIATAAGAFTAGAYIGNAASAVSAKAFAGAVSLIGTSSSLAPLGAAISTVGATVTPIMGVAAPLIAFEVLYPGVMAEKVKDYLG